MYLVCKDNPKFTETSRLIQAADELGIRVESSPDNSDECYFLYGTRNFVKTYLHSYKHIMSGLEHQWDYSYLSSIPHIPLLNRYYDITPVYNLANTVNHYRYSSYDKVFVRPFNGEKEFDGQVFHIDDLRENSLSTILGCYIREYSLCVVSIVKDVVAEEHRYFVFDKDIIGGQYFPEWRFDENLKVKEKVVEYVELISNKEMSVGPYVIDVQVIDDYVVCAIELNSWNSSSFYLIPPCSLLEIIQNNICERNKC